MAKLGRTEVLDLIRKTPGQNVSEIAEFFGVKNAKVSQHLFQLVNGGEVRFEGKIPRIYFATDATRSTPPAKPKVKTAPKRSKLRANGAAKSNGVTHLPGTLVETTVEDLLEARKALAIREVERIEAALEALRSA